MKKEIKNYLPVAQAIVALLHPHAEAVLHDLSTGKIAALINNFSKRKIGDSSLLEKELLTDAAPDYFEPYYKTNWDGRKLKSTTITIRNDSGRPVGLLCINFDISRFDELNQFLQTFASVKKDSSLPKELFHDDWREKIALFVHTYLRKENKSVKSLTKEEKRELIFRLYQDGAFRAKHAANYIGDVLEISRATVYKYLPKSEG